MTPVSVILFSVIALVIVILLSTNWMNSYAFICWRRTFVPNVLARRCDGTAIFFPVDPTRSENGMKLTPKHSRCDNETHLVGMRLGRGGGAGGDEQLTGINVSVAIHTYINHGRSSLS